MSTPEAAGILAAATPESWLEAAGRQWQDLLLDHANCEKKAASTALALIFAYPERIEQNLALARLAREELRHFEQVTRLMQRLQVPQRRMAPGRYAAGLRAACATAEPDRELDLLLAGALIEARSCERFRLLVPRLPAPLAAFYTDLERAEARHESLYLEFAAACAGQDAERWQTRLAQLAAVEAALITSPDDQFRFHSGSPRGSVSSA